MPIASSAHLMVKPMPDATLKAYHGGGHGLAATHKAALNTDLLAFIAR